MAARDDSVIRGSLITCLILLVLSIALNIFLYLVSDRASTDATEAQARLNTVQQDVRESNDKLTRLKTMLGQGQFTQAELDEMRTNLSDDAEMQAIEQQFATDMAMFDATVDVENRNYVTLPKYLSVALRDRNEQLDVSRNQADSIRIDATADVENARKAQALAEENYRDANNRINELDSQYQEERARINQEKEETRDKLTNLDRDYQQYRRRSEGEKQQLNKEKTVLMGTIDTQRKQIIGFLNPQFETPQGEVRYVGRGGNMVTINLGSADALRPNITFGVIDRDEVRLQDATVKANIQVVSIQGPHLAQARVIARPDISSPIIPGDRIYSPFWAPGRTVKIALAGAIDIDNDQRPDNEAVKGQIQAAGAEVVAELSPDGRQTGQLDSSVRFLVVGEAPEVVEVDPLLGGDNSEQLAAFGLYKEKANELGITIIPAWKLEAYLRTIDDSLTTPLGSGVRGDDFLPERQTARPGVPNDIADMYKRQTEGLQRGNEFVSP